MKTIGVYSGKFTADTVIATALALLTTREWKIHMTRDINILKSMDIEINTLTSFDFLAGRVNHKKMNKELFADYKSTSMLIWKFTEHNYNIDYNTREDITTILNTVNSNIYNPIVESINKCNVADLYSKEQENTFNILVELVKNIFISLIKKNLVNYTKYINTLEDLSEKIENENNRIFENREENIIVFKDFLISKFFPRWRHYSKKFARPMIMLGDNPNEYKIVINTKVATILEVNNKVYIHPQGFIAVTKDIDSELKLELSNGTSIVGLWEDILDAF